MSLYLGNDLISGNKPINLGVRNIGEVFPALLPVTDAGAHLLDGSLILGGGIYQGFVDYIANLYNANRTLATVVVRPIAISEGYELGTNSDDTYTAVSNNSFNTGDFPHYIAYSTSTSGESSSSSSSPDEHEIIVDPIDVPSPPSTVRLPANTEITFNNLGIFDYTFGDVTITFQILFDQCTYTGAIPNYFCTESEWQTSVSTYGACGKFVYDDVNNTVRLPKVTGKIDGTTDVNALGDLAPLMVKLPNITAYMRTDALDPSNIGGSFYVSQNESSGAEAQKSSYWRQGTFNFSASRSSSVYSGNGSDTTIHEQAIKMFFYIVVANSTKTDLNGKADTDLINATDQAKILMGGMAMPSDTYTNLTLGASGTQYTAPADGWFYIDKSGNNGTYVGFVNFGINNTYKYATTIPIYNTNGVALLPVKKNDKITVNYNAAGTTNVFRFIYAQGSESEAS